MYRLWDIMAAEVNCLCCRNREVMSRAEGLNILLQAYVIARLSG